MIIEYDGMEMLFQLNSEKFSSKDYKTFYDLSLYLNDILKLNFYNYTEGKIIKEYEEGKRIMKNLLRKYGVGEKEFSPEMLEFNAMVYRAMPEIFIKRLPEAEKKKVLKLIDEKIETADPLKQEKIRENLEIESVFKRFLVTEENNLN
ncbi:MAG: hypothetical protein GTN39_01080 [Candidatus Aenigmarchaeota archaeon]|nr:hypothetical protein [Candidatus Aenigmarchaeota archaeon]